MAKTDFSDDPNTPPNKKINALLPGVLEYAVLLTDQDRSLVKSICSEIYNMGFEDGQAYVWKMRQMLFIDDPENPGKQKAVFPGDPDYPKLDEYITITTGGSTGGSN